MIKSNHNSIKHEQESTLEFRSYMLITLVTIIKTITMFISLLMKTTNSILINHTSTQKTSWAFSQNRSEMKIYYTSNW